LGRVTDANFKSTYGRATDRCSTLPALLACLSSALRGGADFKGQWQGWALNLGMDTASIHDVDDWLYMLYFFQGLSVPPPDLDSLVQGMRDAQTTQHDIEEIARLCRSIRAGVGGWHWLVPGLDTSQVDAFSRLHQDAFLSARARGVAT
jgi:hypothetical protein